MQSSDQRAVKCSSEKCNTVNKRTILRFVPFIHASIIELEWEQIQFPGPDIG